MHRTLHRPEAGGRRRIKILDHEAPLDNDVLPEALRGLDATQQLIQCLQPSLCICLDVSETMLFGEPLADLGLASSGAARQEKVRHRVENMSGLPFATAALAAAWVRPKVRYCMIVA